jgi:arginyl-tRNA synthetase
MRELKEIEEKNKEYFILADTKEQTVVFDYSSPNIAKAFSVGHLRSTVIGQANLNIHKILGFNVVGINHIGDWGTQFGKLIYAIKSWGNEDEIAKNPIKELNLLYVKFHEEAQKDEALNNEARSWFKKLEDGDVEARRIWKKCVDWSMTEFNRIYSLLGVEIDNIQGESFFEDKLQGILDELKKKGLLRESQGAQIVELENLPPALIQKNDEATLYLTRDLAALKYRIETYNPSEIIYHVGNDQDLHFRQLKAVAEKLGWLEKTKIIFAGHGLIRLETGKMSTRKGQVILLDDLILEAKEKSLEIIDKKNPDLKDKGSAAQAIAISAIKYADLSSNRKSDIVFSFDRVVSLKGNSGPYLQYTYARAQSILRKLELEFKGSKPMPHLSEDGVDIARHISKFRNILVQAAKNSNPSAVCDFTFKLCEHFNAFYEKKKIITEDQTESLRNSYIVYLSKTILAICFDILGLGTLDEI